MSSAQAIKNGGDSLLSENINEIITLSYNQITGEYVFENGQESLLILALLLRNYSVRRKVNFNFKYLFDMLQIQSNRKSQKNKIIQCVGRMFSMQFDSDININEIFSLPYETVTDSEVDKILKCDKNLDKFNLFNTYVTIKRYVNKNTGTAYPAISQIMFNTNVASNNTTRKYIEILEELEMIICTRKDEYIVTNDGIRRPNNEYKINYKG